MRVNKENLKTLYRMAFCHFKLENFKDAKNDINNAFNVINKNGGDKTPFEQDILLKKMVLLNIYVCI